jgi:hypothetical protein
MAHKSKEPIGRVVNLNTVEADKGSNLVELEPGGILEWKNHSTHCPHFEILFEGDSPVKPGDKLTGTREQSVSIRMPEKKAEFSYRVLYKKEDGTLCKEDRHLSIRTCPGGGPC